MNLTMTLSNTTPLNSALAGMTDAQVIEKFCSGYNWFLAIMLGLILFLIICRMLIGREHFKHPEREDYKQAYKTLDTFVELFTVALIIFQFLQWTLF